MNKNMEKMVMMMLLSGLTSAACAADFESLGVGAGEIKAAVAKAPSLSPFVYKKETALGEVHPAGNGGAA